MNPQLTQLWSKIVNAHHAIGQAMPPAARDAFAALAAQFGVEPRHIFHFVYVVENFDPNALSVAATQRRDPFDHPQIVQGHLDRWEKAGLIAPATASTYRITPLGHGIRIQRWQIADRFMKQVVQQFPVEWERTINLLSRIINHIAAASEPPTKTNFTTRLRHGLKAPASISCPMQLIECRMSLGAYRDDAHLAAWQETAPDLSPQAWEALTLLWNGTADRLDGLLAALARRGYAKVGYTAAIQELIKRGWVEDTAVSPTLILTQTGQAVRDKAETLTDHYFYTPWQISIEQITFLTSQLNKLKPHK